MIHTIPFHSDLLKKKLVDGTDPSFAHVLIYGAIQFFASGPLGCIASNKTIGELVGLSVVRVSAVITDLARADWVKVVMDDKNHRVSILPLFVLSYPNQNQGAPTSDSSTPHLENEYINNTLNNIKNNTSGGRKRTPAVVELKNDSSDVNALILYFYSKLVPAETTGRRFSAANRKAMDSMLSTYGIPDVRATIDKAKELLGKPYKPQVQSVATLLAKYEQIKAETKVIKHQETTKL